MIVKVTTGRSVHYYSRITRVDTEGIFIETDEGRTGEMVKLDNSSVFTTPSEYHKGFGDPSPTQVAQVHVLLDETGAREIVAVNCSHPHGAWLMTDEGETIDRLKSFAYLPTPERVAEARQALVDSNKPGPDVGTRTGP